MKKLRRIVENRVFEFFSELMIIFGIVGLIIFVLVTARQVGEQWKNFNLQNEKEMNLMLIILLLIVVGIIGYFILLKAKSMAKK